MDCRRTLFATMPGGQTVLLRSFESPGESPSHEVTLYRDYLTPAPRQLPLPRGFPEEFASEEEALEQVHRTLRVEASAFQDIHLGRRVDIDFVEALKRGTLEPLCAGMSADALVALLGLPEGVTPLSGPGFVGWLYGSVQLYLQDDALLYFEIDDGLGEFTSLHLGGWFLEPSTTRRQLEQALTSRGVEYRVVPHFGMQVIWVPGARHRDGCMFDFHEDERIHAFYWLHSAPASGVSSSL
ncbi:hypothetical protein [Pyxidicoccus xibeiensis]|uniref:hypothetical protein n=1 Tax=Pyxidicoccus xibeiensis TaxID=2906759 RepID=UPI0020A7550B|nr:hypothetical protein [Pyxidicoccus xibeiensis]MCP3139131.1 hypothetical protein [Pyxidicoccus xibeiensis]